MEHRPFVPCSCRQFHIPWEHAFDKFGFDDGAYSLTYAVENFLKDAGYDVELKQYGLHNEIITSLIRDNQELMPIDDPDFAMGYSDPRDYLPIEVITLMDAEFGL